MQRIRYTSGLCRLLTRARLCNIIIIKLIVIKLDIGEERVCLSEEKKN